MCEYTVADTAGFDCLCSPVHSCICRNVCCFAPDVLTGYAARKGRRDRSCSKLRQFDTGIVLPWHEFYDLLVPLFLLVCTLQFECFAV